MQAKNSKFVHTQKPPSDSEHVWVTAITFLNLAHHFGVAGPADDDQVHDDEKTEAQAESATVPRSL